MKLLILTLLALLGALHSASYAAEQAPKRSVSEKTEKKGIKCSVCDKTYCSAYFEKHACKPKRRLSLEDEDLLYQARPYQCQVAGCKEAPYEKPGGLIIHYHKKHPEVEENSIDQVIESIKEQLKKQAGDVRTTFAQKTAAIAEPIDPNIEVTELVDIQHEDFNH